MRTVLRLVLLVILTALVLTSGSNAMMVPSADNGKQAKEMVLDLNEKVVLKLVLVPAGKFLMGSPETEKWRSKKETQHEVTISKSFYMGVTHVTVEQFQAFVKDSNYKTDAEKEGQSFSSEIKNGTLTYSSPMTKGRSWHNLGFEQMSDHPVVQISWNDAQAFCSWLSKKSGKTVALPTEAQWEYACRAGTTTAYPWGDNPDDGKGWANCGDQSLFNKSPLGMRSNLDFFNWNDGFTFTSPVASFKPNAFGLYDMIGNAWQWCQDGYGEYDNKAVADPVGVAATDQHVLRGGSWTNFPDDSRAAYRAHNISSYRLDIYGFRVAVAAADKS